METLADRISRDGPLNELDAVGWSIRLAKRIEALHALGVAHGSISPACVVTTAVDRTSKGILVDVRHTPSRIAYQSPERAGGGDLSPADDVWAIAATLYEMLTGTAAFAGATDAEVRQRLATSAPAPLAVFDVGDDDLQHILDSAFQREPAARTRSAAALRRALEEWHPDLAVRSLSPLEDEDSTNDDDEDDVRTVMRAPAFTPEPPRAAGPRPAAGQPMASGPRPAAGQPPAAQPMPAGPRPAAGQPAAPVRPAAGAPAPGFGPSPAGPAPFPAGHVGRVSQPLPDDDDDNAATVMREYPLQQILNAQAAAPAYAPAAPAAAAAPAYAPAAAPARGFASPGGARLPEPAESELGRTVALDTASPVSLPDAPWAGGAAGGHMGPARGQAEPHPQAPGPRMRAPMPSANEDEIYTIARDGPDGLMPDVPPIQSAPHAGFGGAQPPPYGSNAAFPGSAPTFGGAPPQAYPSGSYPMAAPPGPGAGGGVLGPSPVDGFGRGARPSGPGAPPSAPMPFSQPTSGAAPSPFAAPGGGLIIPETPPASPWRGVIIVLVVAIIIGAGVALLAMNTGALSTGG